MEKTDPSHSPNLHSNWEVPLGRSYVLWILVVPGTAGCWTASAGSASLSCHHSCWIGDLVENVGNLEDSKNSKASRVQVF